MLLKQQILLLVAFVFNLCGILQRFLGVELRWILWRIVWLKVLIHYIS
jgi:hypothetical protein